MNQWASEKKSEALYGCGRVTESIGPSFEDPTYGRTVISYKYQGNKHPIRIHNGEFESPSSPIAWDANSRLEMEVTSFHEKLLSLASKNQNFPLQFNFRAFFRPMTGLRIEFISNYRSCSWQSFFFLRFLIKDEGGHYHRDDAVVLGEVFTTNSTLNNVKMYFKSVNEDKFIRKLKKFYPHEIAYDCYINFTEFLDTHVPVPTNVPVPKEEGGGGKGGEDEPIILVIQAREPPEPPAWQVANAVEVQKFRVQNASRIFNLPESYPNMPQNPSPIFASTYGRTLLNFSFQTRDAKSKTIRILARNIEKQPETLFSDLCAHARNSPTAELTFTFSAYMAPPAPITGLRIEFISSMMTSTYQSLKYFFVRFLRHYEENKADYVHAVVLWQKGLKMYFSSEDTEKFYGILREYNLIQSFNAFNSFLELNIPINKDKLFLVNLLSEEDVTNWIPASEEDVKQFRLQNASRILDIQKPIAHELKNTFLESTRV
jgi:hypothetical protein